ncbi:hypothetical protein CspeluHIS016_0108830 [Cutaneotrichosporon spelunceum]|uniref:Uncharacterized protein n=1 Tax=Cutaneotrichosporon spelunceum TaxID=1672016 RepID=A0AAD3TPT6_9TREE|nr:hypothetical protein CspeluHIS016_0108830 [Cutaneotrichosporon spelunceum]
MVGAITLPVSALLPPLDAATAHQKEREAAAHEHLGFDTTPTPKFISLPRLAAVLGLLPASVPLSAASAFLELADLPDFGSPPSQPHDAVLAQPKKHVLVLTGPRAALHLALEEQDPAFLRSHSYALSNRLRRTDIRYCPSVTHLKLLLTVLGAEGVKVAPPSMVVLYDILSLLMAPQDGDKSVADGDECSEDEEPKPAMILRPGVTLASYLGVVAVALELARVAGASLLILEPAGDLALPLVTSASDTVPHTQRTRTAKLSEGLRRLGVTVGQVNGLETETDSASQRTREARYELKFGGETYTFTRSVGTKSEFACPPREEGEPLEEGGWVWEWS